jgi:hypothetical protein
MSHKTRPIYRIPSFKEGITRIFDLSGGIKDDFDVVSVPKKHDSVQAKAHDPLKEGDRGLIRLIFNRSRANVSK